MNARLLFCLALGAALPAADPPTWSWPKVVRVGIEEVKPGREAAHQKNEHAWAKALAQAKSPYHCLGLVPVVGASQAWWVWPYGSLADLEKHQAHQDAHPALKAQVEALMVKDAEFISSYRSMAFLLRPDLSRAPGSLAPRFYWVYTMRVKPGHDAGFAEVAKAYGDLYDKAGLSQKWAVYQAVAGTSNPTFLWVMPLHSLAEADQALADDAKMAQAAGPETLKTLAKAYGDCLLSEEAQLLGVDPKMSYPDAGDLALDPEFWKVWAAKPAEMSAGKPTAKKGAKEAAP
jgi:hypothetical protein